MSTGFLTMVCGPWLKKSIFTESDGYGYEDPRLPAGRRFVNRPQHQRLRGVSKGYVKRRVPVQPGPTKET